MEAKYEGLKLDKKGTPIGPFEEELLKARKAGVAQAPLDEVPNLCFIAHRVTPGADSRREVEALIELLIKRRFAALPSRQEEMRLTFGIHGDTREATSNERHKAAWNQHVKTPEGRAYAERHYKNNRTLKYRNELALELLAVYKEHRAAAVATPESAAIDDAATEPASPAPERSGRVEKRRLAAAVLVVAIAATVLLLVVVDPFAGNTAATDHDPSLHQLAAEDNRLIALNRTPVPGEASRILGYGDEAGGRQMYAYGGNHNYTTLTPTLDSIDDAPYEYPNERKFAHVLILSRQHIDYLLDHEEPRSARLPVNGGKLASVRVWVENSAAVLGPCHTHQPTTAAGVRLRLGIWDSPNHKLHVVRAWLFGRNTEPRWITDAVAVTTPRAARLVLMPALSNYWLRQTHDRYLFPAVNALKPAGTAIGVGGTGRIGSCWKEDLNYNLVFRPQAITQ